MHQHELPFTCGKNVSMVSTISPLFHFSFLPCKYNKKVVITCIYHLESKESIEANLDTWDRTSEDDAAPLFPTGTGWLPGALPMCDNQSESWVSSSSFA
jgi:hypothetical protein